MSLLRSPKLRSIRSRLASIRDRFGGKPRKAAGQLKHRSLLIDPLEARTLLSVSPANWDDVLVNQTIDSLPQGTLEGQSIAVDQDGDFVVAWTRYDQVLDPSTGVPVIDPATGNPMQDANIYARYFTDEVQRLTLPDAITVDSDGNDVAGSFSLVYGGNEIQKISITATWEPFWRGGTSLIAGQVTYGFDVNDNGIVGPGETATVFFDEGAENFTTIAANFETALQGLGGALTDVDVIGINPHEYIVEFGDLSLGEDQPEITVESVTFTSGFLPAVITSTVREPVEIGPIPVHATDPYQTANAIEQHFLLTTDDFIMGPIKFPPTNDPGQPAPRIDWPEGPQDYPDWIRMAVPGVTARPVWEVDPADGIEKPSTTKFDLTFDGGRTPSEGASGKTDHPLLVVSAAAHENGSSLVFHPDVNVETLKEPSPEFRVNPAEPDNPFTPLPDRFNQRNADIAMDADGEFVITWESAVPDIVQFGSVSDVFARRFRAVGLVDPGDVELYVDADLDGVVETPVQGVRALDGGFRVNTTTTGPQGEPAVGMDRVGNFVIAWGSGFEGFSHDLPGQDFSYFNGIHAQRYHRDGTPLGDEILVNTELTLIHFAPYVAMGPEGNTIITWTTTNDENFLNEFDLRLVTTEWKLYGPDGTVIIPQRSLGTGGGSAAAFDGGGNYAITWDVFNDSDNTGNTSEGVRAVMYEAPWELVPGSGNWISNQLRSEFRANSSTLILSEAPIWPGWQGDAEPAFDADGDLTIVYEGTGPEVSEDTNLTGAPSTDRMEAYRQALIDRFYKPENADLLVFFDPAVESFPVNRFGDMWFFDSGGNFVSLGSDNEIDTDIENILIRAATRTSPPATDVQLGRIRALIDEVAGLMRGDAWGVMYSNYDTNPELGPSNRLNSDSVMNNERDGHNQRYILMIPTWSTGGNFNLRLWNIYTPGTEVVNIAPVYNNNVLNVTQTRNAIETALEAATRTGDQYSPHSVPGQVPFEGPVRVRTVSSGFGSVSSEITGRQGTYWDYDNANMFWSPDLITDIADDAVYEITFQGEVHDSPLGLSVTTPNNLNPTGPRPVPRVFELMDGDTGTDQHSVSIGMERDGDFVTVWTQDEEYTWGGTSNRNIYFRRFSEDTDTAGPLTTGVAIHDGELPLELEPVSSPVSHAVLMFDEPMYVFNDDLLDDGLLNDSAPNNSVFNTENYRLFANGIEVSGGIAGIQYGMNKASDLAGTIDPITGMPFDLSSVPTNKWEAVITIDGDLAAPGAQALLAGTYTIEALAPIPPTSTSHGESGLRDEVGNPLSSSGYLPGGQNLSHTFVVTGSTPTIDYRLDPVAGIAANGRGFPESAQQVAVDADGDHVVVWTAGGLTGVDRVYMALYDADGTQVSPILEVTAFDSNAADFAGDAQRYPTVDADKDGDFVVTWTNYSGGDTDIYARRFDSVGQALGDSFRVNAFGVEELDPADPTRTNQKWSHVAVDLDGDFVITWASYAQEQNGNLGTGYGVYARKYNAQVDRIGTQIIPPRPATPEFQVNTTTGGNQSTPSIDMDAFGNFVIAWTSDQGGLSDDIVARVFTSDGAPIPIAGGLGFTGWQAGEILVNQTTDGAQRYPNVAMDLGGTNFVVTWSGSGQDGSGWGVFGRTFSIPIAVVGDLDPTVGVVLPASNEFQVNTTTLANQLFSSVAMNHQGDFVVTWSGYGNQFDQEDESGFGVFSQRFNLDTSRVGQELRLNNDVTGDQWLPSVDMDGEGNFVTVWTGLGTVPNPFGIYRYISEQVEAVFDVVPPIVTDVLFDGGRVYEGAVLDPTVQPIGELEVVFGEQVSIALGTVGFDSVLNPLNWSLERDGGEVIGWIASNGINFRRDVTTDRKYIATITIDTDRLQPGNQPLLPGAYTLTVQSAITDGANELDGDYDGQPATSPERGFVRDFFVRDNPNNGPEFRINEETRFLQHVSPTQGTGFAREENNRSVAVDHDGDFVVVWTSYGQDYPSEPQGAGVYYRMYDRNNVPLTPETPVNTTLPGDQRNASVAMDADGDFVIVWEAKNVYPDGRIGDHVDESWGVYGRRFNALGEPVISDTDGNGLIDVHDTDQEFLLNSDTLGDQTDPAVTVDSLGNFATTWVHTHGQNLSFFHDVNVQRYNRRGERVGGEFQANSQDIPGVPGLGRLPSGGGGTEVNPQVAVDDAGNLVVVWELIALQQDGAKWDTLIVGRLFDSDSIARVNTWTGSTLEFQISPDTIENTPAPAFGNFRSDPEHREHQNPADPVPTDLHRTARNPQITMDDQGNFIVVWESFQDNDFDEDPDTTFDFTTLDPDDWPDSYGIYFRRFDTSGTPDEYFNANLVNTGIYIAGPPIILTYDPNFAFAQVNPSVAIDGDGDFAVVWNGNGAEPRSFTSGDPRQVVNHDNEGVFARWFHTGNSTRPAEYVTQQQRVNYTQGGVQHFPSIAMEPDGDSIVVWSGAGAGDRDGILARRYDEPVDNAGPRTFEMWQEFADGRPRVLADGAEDLESPQYLVVVFDEAMWAHEGWLEDGTGVPWDPTKDVDSVENPDNWVLMRGGEEIEDIIASVKFTLNPATNKYEAVVTFSVPLSGGDYILLALAPVEADPVSGTVPHSGLRDAIGNPLARTGLTPDGTDMSFLFTAITEGGGVDDWVGPGTTYAEAQGAVAVDADGDYVIAWTKDVSFRDRVFVQLFDADGTLADLDLNGDGYVANEDTDGDGVIDWGEDLNMNYVLDPGEDTNWNGRLDGVEDRDMDGILEDTERDNAPAIEVTTDPAFASDDQRYPTIASDSDGDFIVTWTNYRGGDADIYARRFNSLGEPQAVNGDAFRVNDLGKGDRHASDPPATHQKWSEVDMDVDGDFVVTWSSYAQEDRVQLGTGYGVYARRYDSFGQPLAREFQVNVTTEGNQMLSNVAVDAEGGFVVVWTSDQNGVGTDIVARSYWADGSPQPGLSDTGYLYGEIVVNTNTDGNQTYPDVDMSADGSSYVVTWTGPDTNHSGIYGRQITRQTLVQAEPRAVFESEIPPEGIPIPHIGTLVWTLDVDESFSIADLDVAIEIIHPRPSDLTVSLISPAGTLVTLADRVPQQPTGNYLGVQGDAGNFVGTIFDDQALVAIDAYPTAQPPFAGRFQPAPDALLAFNGENIAGQWLLRIVDSRLGPYAPDWFDVDPPPDPPIEAALKKWSLDARIGLRATDEFLVNTTVEGAQTFSSVSMDHRGDFVVTWSGRGDQSGQEDMTEHGIFYQQFDLSASRVGNESRANFTIEGNQWLPSISSSGSGNFVIVWTGPRPNGPPMPPPGDTFVYKFDGSKAQTLFDNDGPIVTDVLTVNRDRVEDGDIVGQAAATELIVVFSEDLTTRMVLFDQNRDGFVDLVTDPTVPTIAPAPGPDSPMDLFNWTLERNGLELPGAVTDVAFGWNENSRKYEAVVTLDGNRLTPANDPLPEGNYVLTVHDNINDRYRYSVQQEGAFVAEYEDPFFGGNALDGDFNGSPGTRLDGTGYTGYKLNFGVSGVSNEYGAEFRISESTYPEQRFSTSYGTGLGYEQSTRSVAVDHDGDFVVAWTSYGQDDPTDSAGAGVYVRMYDRNNNPIVQPDPNNPGSTREMPAVRVNSVVGGEQRNAAVAIDADGEFVVVWEARNEHADGTSGDNPDDSWGVYGQRFNSVGEPVGAQFLVNSNTQQDQLNPAVAMDEFGNFVVVWATKAQPFSFFNDVRGQVFNYRGERVNNEFLVNQATIPGTALGPGSVELNPAVAMDAAGNFVVAWDQIVTQVNGAATDGVIVARMFEPDGTPRTNAATGTTDEFQVNVGDDGFVGDPQHVPEDAGGGNEIEDRARNPQVAMDGAGNFTVVWEAFQDNDVDGASGTESYGVYFRRYDADGTEQWDVDHQANLVITDTANTAPVGFNSGSFAFGQVNPSIGMDADGDYAVVWNGNGATPHPVDPMTETVTNGDTEGVWIRQFHARDPEDVPEFVGVQTRVNLTSGGIQQFPTLGMEPDGDMIVVWSGTGVGDRHGIYARRYDEPTDTAGPRVSDLQSITGDRIEFGAQLTQALSHLVVVFDEDMMRGNVGDGVSNPQNYTLLKDGVELVGGIRSIDFDLNPDTNKWEAVLELDGNGVQPGIEPLGDGHYEIVVSGSLRDVVGNPMYRTGLVLGGDDFGGQFDIVVMANQEVLVNDTAPGDQITRVAVPDGVEHSPQAVAGDADGEYVAVWTDTTPGQEGVYAKVYNHLRWFDTAGGRVSTGPVPDKDVLVTSNPTAVFASVARDADGDFVVTWSQNDGTALSPDWNVWARRYDATGTPFAEGEFQVNSVTQGTQRYSTVAMDTDGDFVVTWQSDDSYDSFQGRARDGDGYGVYAQRYSPTGQPLGGSNEVQILTFVANPVGTFTLAWDGDENPATVNVTRPITIDGNPFAAVDQIEAELNNLAGDVNRVEVQAISLTEVMVHFIDQGASKDQEQIEWDDSLSSFADPNSAITTATALEGYRGEFLVNDTTANNQMFPSVAMDASGNIVITWTSAGQVGDASHETNIYAKQFVSNDSFRYLSDAAGGRNYDWGAGDRYPDVYFAVSTDDPQNHVVDPGTGYDGVVGLGINGTPFPFPFGTGTLLSTGRHILTAAHVVDSGGGIPWPVIDAQFDLPTGPVTMTSTQIFIHPGWNGDIFNADDLAIIVLPEEAPAAAERYGIYRASDELNQVVDMLGYGIAGQGVEQFSDNLKRIENNVFEAYGEQLNGMSMIDFSVGFGSFNIPSGKLLMYDFDSGLPANDALGRVLGIHDLGLGHEEGTSSHGDSGGPGFINGLLASVVSGGVEYAPADSDGIPFNVSFGTVGFHTRVSAYADWIDMISQSTSAEFLVNDVPIDPVTGLPPLDPVTGEPITTGNQKWSSVAMDANGDFVITWTSYDQDGSPNPYGSGYLGEEGVFAKRYNSDGSEVQAIDPSTGQPKVHAVTGQAMGEFQVNTGTDGKQQHPQVSMDADGDFMISWESSSDRPGLNPDSSSNFGIYAQRYAANARRNASAFYGPNGEIGGELAINATMSGDQRFPSLALDHTGDAAVLWAGNGQLPFADQADDQGIFHQRFEKLEDDAGPTVSDLVNVVNDGGKVVLEHVPEGVVLDTQVTQMLVSFGENLFSTVSVLPESITTLDNWVLTRDGEFLRRGVSSVEFGLNQSSAGGAPILSSPTNKYEAVITLDGDPDQAGNQPLGPGLYELWVRSYVEDEFGNRLDGDYDGTPGGDFRRAFVIAGSGASDGSGDPDDLIEDPDEDDEDYLVHYEATRNQDDPAVASDAEGNYVVAWVESDYTTGEVDVMARRFDHRGNPRGGEFIVNSYRTGHQLEPDVAMDAYGNFVVTWSGEGEIDDVGTLEFDGIFARVFDAFGQPLDEQFAVNQSGAARPDPQRTPSVAMDEDGDIVISWTSYGQDGDRDGIYARRYDFLGQPKGDEFLVNTRWEDYQDFSDVAMDDNGNFVIIWSAYRHTADNSEWGVFGQRYRASGAALGGEFPINTYTADDQTDAHVAMDADGDFVVAWSSYLQDSSGWGVYARRFDSAASPLGAPDRVNETQILWQYQTDVAMDDDGNYVVTWCGVGQDNVDADDGGIFARVFSADGSNRYATGEFQINVTVAGNQFDPVVAMDADGDFPVVWVGPDGSGNGVFYRHFPVNTSGGSGAPGYAGGGFYWAGGATTTSSVLQLNGTPGNDLFEFVADVTAASSVVKINGVTQAVPAGVTSIRFDGLDGYDKVVFTGSLNDEMVELWTDHGQFKADRYTVSATNVERTDAHSGGGSDTALLYDDADGTDRAEIKPDYGRLNGAGFDNRVYGYRYVHAYATEGFGDVALLYDDPHTMDTAESEPEEMKLYGDGFYSRAVSFDYVHAFGTPSSGDVAYLYDDPATQDTFEVTSEYGKLFGENFFSRVQSFRYVHAYATVGGGDVGLIHDDAGSQDTFEAWPDRVKLFGDGFFYHAEDFNYIHAYATAGDGDVAKLYDDPVTQDKFEAWPDQARLSGDGFFVRTKAFGYVHAYATPGGNDVALLYDDPNTQDTLEGRPQDVKLYNDDFFSRAKSFRYVHAYATKGGNDVAFLYDDPSTPDTLKTWPNQAKLYGDEFFTRAKSFRYVHAYATPGSGDVAYMYDSDGDDVFKAWPDQAKLYGNGFFTRAKSFSRVNAYSTSAGNDSAYLYDSALEAYPDHLQATANWAMLSNDPLGFAYWVGDFEAVSATSSNDSDTKDIDTDALDFILRADTW